MDSRTIVDPTLPEKIKKWVVLDSQLKLIGEKTKTIREMRNLLETEIIDHLEERGLTNKKIGIGNGSELKIVDKKEFDSAVQTVQFGKVEGGSLEVICLQVEDHWLTYLVK